MQRLAIKCQVGTDLETVPLEAIEREAWKEVSAPCLSLHSVTCMFLAVACLIHVSNLQ